MPCLQMSRLRLRCITPRGAVEFRGLQVPLVVTWPCTHLHQGRLRGQQELAGRPGAFSSSSAEHLHVIWERVTCGSHQAEERLNQGLITVCLEGSGPK